MLIHPPARRPRIADHPVFLAAALVSTGVVAVGFAPTWFLRAFYPLQASLTPLVQLHGVLMTAWFCLFLVQIVLVATGRTALHRRLGRLGAVLLALIVVTAVPTTLVAARLGGDHMPGPPAPGLAFVGGFLIAFSVFAATGLALVRRPDVHKRLMLIATLTAMEAGTLRLPLDFLGSPLAGHAVTDGLLLLVIVIDSVRHRRLHPAFLWGGLCLVGTQLFLGWVGGTDAWAAVARRLINLV